MELACSCYSKALESDSLPEEDRRSLTSRHGNMLNELGVFFMNQATALVQKVSDGEEPESSQTTGNLYSKLFTVVSRFLNHFLMRYWYRVHLFLCWFLQ